MANNEEKVILQQLILERTQLEGARLGAIKTLSGMESLLKNKINERKLFRALKIIGFENDQKEEIESFQKNLEQGNTQLVLLRKILVSKERRINALQR